MDIFSAPLRSKEESITKALNYPQESETQHRLQQDNKREMEKLNNFLRNLYMRFDFKVNRCKNNCIVQAASYQAIAECEHQCQEGVSKLGAFVENRVQEMQSLLGECVANASTLHNSMDQIYYCYEIFNLGFNSLKKQIVEESLYYE